MPDTTRERLIAAWLLFQRTPESSPQYEARRHIVFEIDALCRSELTTPDLRSCSYEVAYGGNIITDVVVPAGDDSLCIEFHHLSATNCKAASMASYIMDKIRAYAWHHQLIPR